MGGVRGTQRPDTRQRMLERPWQLGGPNPISSREAVLRAQANREALYEAAWGPMWTAPLPVPQPVPLPPMHRVKTDRCEQPQPDGSWVVATRDLCTVCEERVKAAEEEVLAAAREQQLRLAAMEARQRELERQADRARAARAARVHYWRTRPQPPPLPVVYCPACHVPLAVPDDLAPGRYTGTCRLCAATVPLVVEAP
jgi:hypothetical protein